MIQSFADKTTAAIFAGLEVRRLPRELQQRAAEKLALLNAAHTVDDLRIPLGNRLKKRSGDRAGQWSIRINSQWRIGFTFASGDAFDVEIVDALCDVLELDVTNNKVAADTYTTDDHRTRPDSRDWHDRPDRCREDDHDQAHALGEVDESTGLRVLDGGVDVGMRFGGRLINRWMPTDSHPLATSEHQRRTIEMQRNHSCASARGKANDQRSVVGPLEVFRPGLATGIKERN